jgi:mRNA interferase RelE/StbE
MYAVFMTRDAIKALRRLPRKHAAAIRAKIGRVARDPYAPNANLGPLHGRPGFRLRAGDWRVIYELDDARRIMTILAIGPRGGVYR